MLAKGRRVRERTGEVGMKRLSDELRDFLLAPRFGVLATIDPKGFPRQSVMWYDLLEDDAILMNTAEGRAKLADLRRHPWASLCVPDEYRYVTLAGPVELIDEQARAQADIARLAVRYVGAEEAQQWIPQFRRQRRITIVLRPERILAHGFSGA